MTDQFIREVDEEIREERTMRLLKTAAPAIVAAFLVVTVGVVANQILSDRRTAVNRTESVRFDDAVAEADADALRALSAEAVGGYGPLALLERARSAKARGEVASAVEVLDAAARDERASVALRRFAAVQAATLRLDRASYDEMAERLGALSLVNTPLGVRAKELLAYSAWRAGRVDEARAAFEALSDAGSVDLRVAQRAAAMVELIDTDPSGGLAGAGAVDLTEIIEGAGDGASEAPSNADRQEEEEEAADGAADEDAGEGGAGQ